MTAIGLALLAPSVLAQQPWQPADPPAANPGPAPTGAPVSLFPPAPAGAEPVMADPPPATPPADARGVRGVMVEELKAQDPELAGTLGPDNGGLPSDLWQGLPRGDLETLIAAVPAGLTSPALRDMASRLLLTAADGVGPGTRGRNLAALRAEALVRIGNADGADALRSLAPAVLDDEEAALAWLEMRYFTDDRQAACDQVPVLLSRFRHPVWQKWQIVCQIVAGQPDMALLGLDMLREQGEKDELFTLLAEGAITGNDRPVRGVPEPTPTQFALILASGRAFPPETRITGAGPLTALARVDGLALPQRLAAAERAAALGALTAEGLRGLYEAVPLPDPKTLTVAAAKKPTPLLRAQIIRALAAEPTPAAKAGLFKVAMLAAGTEMQAGPYGALLLEEARQFRLTIGFASVAPLVARLHLLHGDLRNAGPWLNLARDDFNAGKDEGAFARLWPLAAAHGLVREADFDRAGWQRDLGGNAARDTMDSVLILLGALENTPMALPPLADGSAPPGQVKGAVLLDAVIALGTGGPAGMPALDLAAILTDLTRAGLDAQARRIGAEAIAGLLRPEA